MTKKMTSGSRDGRGMPGTRLTSSPAMTSTIGYGVRRRRASAPKATTISSRTTKISCEARIPESPLWSFLRCAGGGLALPACREDLAHQDLRGGRDRDGDDRARQTEQLSHEEDGQGGDQRVDVDRAAEDQRAEHASFQLPVEDEVEAGDHRLDRPAGAQRQKRDGDAGHQRTGVG